MSAIKDGRLPIMLDQERHMLFSLNILDLLNDKFGGFDQMDTALQGKDGMKNLRWLLTILLNEGADEGEPELTEKQVGKLIHTGNMAEVQAAMFRAFTLGNTGSPDAEPEEFDEDEDEDGEGPEGNGATGKE